GAEKHLAAGHLRGYFTFTLGGVPKGRDAQKLPPRGITPLKFELRRHAGLGLVVFPKNGELVASSATDHFHPTPPRSCLSNGVCLRLGTIAGRAIIGRPTGSGQVQKAAAPAKTNRNEVVGLVMVR